MEWMPSDDEKESGDEYEDAELEFEIDDNVDSINEKQTHFSINFWFLNFVCCSFSPYAIFALVHVWKYPNL